MCLYQLFYFPFTLLRNKKTVESDTDGVLQGGEEYSRRLEAKELAKFEEKEKQTTAETAPVSEDKKEQ